ncbi:MAG: polysaccharide deacetylase family protein [Anaerolineales bacterium]
MESKKLETGYFILSLDTELATGFFDYDEKRKRLFSADGSREREKIARLLTIFDQYKITATWAVVGHLFYDHCEECDICPLLAWKGKYESFEEAYKTNHPLWYGADVIDMLLEHEVKHEIAFHGYIHEIFTENRMSKEQAEIEIQEYLRVAKRRGITPTSIVFPRDQAGYLDLFEKYGFQCYRSEIDPPFLFRQHLPGRILKTIDHILGITTAPIFELDDFQNGQLVKLLPSQEIFGFNRKTEVFLDNLNMPLLRIRRIARAIRKAADQKKVVHIWAHPWQFDTEKDFEKLCCILENVTEEVQRERMKSVSMAEMAAMVSETHDSKI